MSNATSKDPEQANNAQGSAGHLRQYVIGFVLSLLLTLASFGVVMAHGTLSKPLLLSAIVALCVAQLIVQLVFFLHLGWTSEQRSHTGIFLCTGGLIVIIVGLSLWVMHNANVNMMPTQMSIDRAISRD